MPRTWHEIKKTYRGGSGFGRQGPVQGRIVGIRHARHDRPGEIKVEYTYREEDDVVYFWIGYGYRRDLFVVGARIDFHPATIDPEFYERRLR